MKRNITVKTYNLEDRIEGQTIDKAIKELEILQLDISTSYKGCQATIEMDYNYDPDNRDRLMVFVKRLETDEEEAVREKEEADRISKYEREAYERLKAKFEGDK
jgi:hypothetical protein